MSFSLNPVSKNKVTLKRYTSDSEIVIDDAEGDEQYDEQYKERNLPQYVKPSRTGAILAVTIPIASALTSIVWAISIYLIVRERQRALVELARIEAETQSR